MEWLVEKAGCLKKESVRKMRKVYDKPWLEVVDFQKEAVMSDSDLSGVVFDMPEEGYEDGGDY